MEREGTNLHLSKLSALPPRHIGSLVYAIKYISVCIVTLEVNTVVLVPSRWVAINSTKEIHFMVNKMIQVNKQLHGHHRSPAKKNILVMPNTSNSCFLGFPFLRALWQYLA